MTLSPSSALLDEILRIVVRRYRLPKIATESAGQHEANPATALALAIEQARMAVARGAKPDDSLKRLFVEALARMIDEAMRTASGDPVFQAMLLRHRVTEVREYASLSAQADQDRRQIHAAVNAIAHPGKQQGEALARLHACASSSLWPDLADAVRRVLDLPEVANDSPLRHRLTRLLDSPALERLQRLEAVMSDERVRQYLSLLERRSPRSGSAEALAQGSIAKQRGAAAEALAARALEALARRLDEAGATVASYRVVTSLRVPSSIPGNADRAKTEWDAVLLRQAKTDDGTDVWDVCLLVEAKASVDAAATDFPRLLRGLRLLACAERNIVYVFESQQGTVGVSGASLGALTTDEASLERRVLYCCDAPVETTPRLFSAASRMQLLSAQASLEYASTLMDKQHADTRKLEPVWHELLESRRLGGVLNQYATLREARELMVHTDDLLAAIHG